MEENIHLKDPRLRARTLTLTPHHAKRTRVGADWSERPLVRLGRWCSTRSAASAAMGTAKSIR